MYRIFRLQRSFSEHDVPVFGAELLGAVSNAAASVLSAVRMDVKGFESLDDAIARAKDLRSDPDVSRDTVEIVGEAPDLAKVETEERPIACGVAIGKPDIPPYHRFQPYLDGSASCGLGIRTAWASTRGESVSLIDVEQGWAPHEDLPTPHPLHWPVPTSPGIEHGVQVMGLIAARHDKRGIHGIAPDCERFAVVQIEKKDPASLFTGVLRAISVGWRPLVVLIEDQRQMTRWLPNGRRTADKMPLEASWLGRFLVSVATMVNIHVVQVAGNGTARLDDWLWPRPSDSGSIVVGAACPAKAERSAGNWGSRVDLSGWGKNIVTCGFFNQYVPSSLYDFVRDSKSEKCYTKSFGDTSGAAAMVAGCVALLASYAHSKQRGLSPRELRTLLKATGYMGPKDAYPIGPRPDLAAAIAFIAAEQGSFALEPGMD